MQVPLAVSHGLIHVPAVISTRSTRRDTPLAPLRPVKLHFLSDISTWHKKVIQIVDAVRTKTCAVD